MSRETTRERLVLAAADLFYETGIHQTGVDQVIERAGLSKPTLYQHFRSKNDLVVAVLEHWAEHRQELLGEIVADESRPARDRLIAIFRFFEEWFRQSDFRGCGLVNAATEIPSRDDPGREVASRHKAWMTRSLERLARQADLREPKALAQSLVLLIEGATVTAYVQSSPGAGRVARRAAERLIESHTP